MQAILFFSTFVLSAQPAFDIASIRPHTTEIRSVGVDLQGSRINASAMTARELITFAYDLREYQIVGTEPWASQSRWDILATTGDLEPSRPQVRQMMQRLLADRFHLTLHPGSQEFPVYLMTIAKSGVKLKPPTPFDTERSTFNADGAFWQNAPLDILGNPFPLHLDRPLINRTGLTDRYDFSLKFNISLEEAKGQDGESIFTALEEQLGLHVAPGRATLETLVVDHIELPSEN